MPKGIGELSLPFASVHLPPCIEHAITHGPCDGEEMEWILILARYWKGHGAGEEVVIRDIIEWYVNSDAVEPLEDEDIKSLVAGVYVSDRSQAVCQEMYRIHSFKKGCARTDCPYFNPPEKKAGVEIPRMDLETFLGSPKPQAVNIGTLAEALVSKLNIKRMPGGGLAVYNNGIYVIDDSEFIIDRVVRSYLTNELNTKLKSNLFLHIKAIADAVTWDDFERHTHLLCCPNCVVDLTTGEALDHSPEYMMLHKTRVSYKPKAERKLWDKVLEDIILDVNVTQFNTKVPEKQLKYYQTAWGYSITGETRDEVAFIHQGEGASGKTTITSSIQYPLGAYVQQVDPDILMTKADYYKPAYELANGVGKRIFLTNESKDGAKINTQLIKSIATEGMEFNARQIREKAFTYISRAKTHMVMNPMPILDERDRAVQRRLHLIRYYADFSKKPDKSLKKQLHGEAEGVLAWLIEGAIAYYKESLIATKAIAEAVEYLFDETDPLFGFMDDCIIVDSKTKTNSRDLLNAFKRRCNSFGIKTDKIEPRWFGRNFNTQLKLKGLKYDTSRSNGLTIYHGLGLIEEHHEDA